MSLSRQILAKTAQSVQWSKAVALCSRRMASVGSRDAPPIDVNAAIARPEEVERKKKLSGAITVPTKVDLSPISGVPEEHIKTRRVRIHVPPKNAMQSGTDNVQHWQIEFDNRERWENPLMGWTSTGDPLSNMQVEFGSKAEAIEHCERNGWRWFVDADEKPKKERVKNYGLNFHWNRRTRVSTK
ncbi:PREDICTED: NADH dehydrogenase [ubiquinone] iron-sulfur protein 4, mitochondrial [Rhagoletis zephyria]|uniref:NADH dehydrogenase [ubiquinone] iron-sulfur protein 4, mitochondrial n=1 Tax=Rhagoletis zephyria TaxID=28612 RepID=UPI00081142B6|nr:PREDICTED: NADH dehydrogenase [ubiquinone] iron-sulfur protein 4, mitochondrial [Rhagoletis zephyria]XP_036338886.1 NADH dehydrogenase [ubiquinone] iron-sulfur protein 4, mitochondrial [Rhagoletis pomonella]